MNSELPPLTTSSSRHSPWVPFDRRRNDPFLRVSKSPITVMRRTPSPSTLPYMETSDGISGPLGFAHPNALHDGGMADGTSALPVEGSWSIPPPSPAPRPPACTRPRAALIAPLATGAPSAAAISVRSWPASSGPTLPGSPFARVDLPTRYVVDGLVVCSLRRVRVLRRVGMMCQCVSCFGLCTHIHRPVIPSLSLYLCLSLRHRDFPDPISSASRL